MKIYFALATILGAFLLTAPEASAQVKDDKPEKNDKESAEAKGQETSPSKSKDARPFSSYYGPSAVQCERYSWPTRRTRRRFSTPSKTRLAANECRFK